jgi:hypothetical protein
MVTVLPMSAHACEATLAVAAGSDADETFAHVIRPVSSTLTLAGTAVPGTCEPLRASMTLVHGVALCAQHVWLDPALAPAGTCSAASSILPMLN